MAAAATTGFFRRQGTKIFEFWKNLGDDYWGSVKGILDECKNKPWKGAVAGTTIAGLTAAYITNPDERAMIDELRQRRQQMVTVPTSCHNTRTNEELSLRTRLLNQNRLEHFNFLFFSLLVRREHDANVRVYHTQDSNINDWFVKATLKNVMDVGLFGRWYHLERSFANYDINDDEFPPEVDSA